MKPGAARSYAAVVAAAGIALAGCGAPAGGPSAGTGPPMAIAMTGASSLASARAGHPARSRTAPGAGRAAAPSASAAAGRRPEPSRAVTRAGQRSAPPPPTAAGAVPTPPAPRHEPAPARAIALADAGRLASPACATLVDALAGRFPDAVAARGSQRALAFVTQSVAAALLGLPVVVPQSSRPARERLDTSLTRLSRALAGEDQDAVASARAMAPRIRAYAAALRIGACG